MLPIQDYYTQCLTALGCTITDDSVIELSFMVENPVPVKVGGACLLFPSDRLLASGFPENTVAFHPLCEQLSKGESAVFGAMCTTMNFVAKSALAMLVTELIDLALDRDRLKVMSPKQKRIFQMIPNVNQNTAKDWARIVKSVIALPDRDGLLHILALRSGLKGKQKFTRGARITSPLYAKLDEYAQGNLTIKDIHEYLGTTGPSKKSLLTIHLLLTEILEEDLIGEGITDGTFSTVAPYWTSMMEAFGNIMGRFNNVITRVNGRGTGEIELKSKVVPLGYLDYHGERMKVVSQDIPPLDGNLGTNQCGEEVAVPTAPANAAGIPLPEDSEPPFTPDPPSTTASAPHLAPAQPVVANTGVGSATPHLAAQPAAYQPPPAQHVGAGRNLGLLQQQRNLGLPQQHVGAGRNLGLPQQQAYGGRNLGLPQQQHVGAGRMTNTHAPYQPVLAR